MGARRMAPPPRCIVDDYLDHVTPEQSADLARRVQETVRGWLNEIYPNGSPFWMAQDMVLQTVALPADILEKRAAELR